MYLEVVQKQQVVFLVLFQTVEQRLFFLFGYTAFGLFVFFHPHGQELIIPYIIAFRLL